MKILHAKAEHIIYSKEISLCIDESAKVRVLVLPEGHLNILLKKLKIEMLL